MAASLNLTDLEYGALLRALALADTEWDVDDAPRPLDQWDREAERDRRALGRVGAKIRAASGR